MTTFTQVLFTPPRTAWDEIVGVPVEQWMAATTFAEFAELLARRDRGEFLPPAPITLDVHRAVCGASMNVVRVEERRQAVAVYCDCGLQFAPEGAE